MDVLGERTFAISRNIYSFTTMNMPVLSEISRSDKTDNRNTPVSRQEELFSQKSLAYE